jgi:hypothetical protein
MNPDESLFSSQCIFIIQSQEEKRRVYELFFFQEERSCRGEETSRVLYPAVSAEY